MLEFGVCILIRLYLIHFIEWHRSPVCFVRKCSKLFWMFLWCHGGSKSSSLTTPMPTLPPPRKKIKNLTHIIKLFPCGSLQGKHCLLKQMGNCQGNRRNCYPFSHPWTMPLILLMAENCYRFKQCPMYHAEVE